MDVCTYIIQGVFLFKGLTHSLPRSAVQLPSLCPDPDSVPPSLPPFHALTAVPPCLPPFLPRTLPHTHARPERPNMQQIIFVSNPIIYRPPILYASPPFKVGDLSLWATPWLLRTNATTRLLVWTTKTATLPRLRAASDLGNLQIRTMHLNQIPRTYGVCGYATFNLMMTRTR